MDSRIIKLAQNKRNKEIKKLHELKAEMVSNKVPDHLIEDFELSKLREIEKAYKEKINDKSNYDKVFIYNLRKQKKKEIKAIIKTVQEMEKRNVSKEYIESYSNKEYNRINKLFDDLMAKHNIKFID